MVIEYRLNCSVCGSEALYPEENTECKYCGYSVLETIETVERDESKGFCTVGIEGDDVIDCQLVATHRAETEKFEENDTYAQKICSEHAEKWEGLEGVVEIWKV